MARIIQSPIHDKCIREHIREAKFLFIHKVCDFCTEPSMLRLRPFIRGSTWRKYEILSKELPPFEVLMTSVITQYTFGKPIQTKEKYIGQLGHGHNRQKLRALKSHTCTSYWSHVSGQVFLFTVCSALYFLYLGMG